MDKIILKEKMKPCSCGCNEVEYIITYLGVQYFDGESYRIENPWVHRIECPKCCNKIVRKYPALASIVSKKLVEKWDNQEYDLIYEKDLELFKKYGLNNSTIEYLNCLWLVADDYTNYCCFNANEFVGDYDIISYDEEFYKKFLSFNFGRMTVEQEVDYDCIRTEWIYVLNDDVVEYLNRERN
jgi:hypothetical protein